MAKSVKALLPELKNYITTAMNDAVVSVPNTRIKRQLELHPSGFPYCAIRTLYDELQGAPPAYVEESFSGSYFTSVGTLVHSLIQTFMGLGGRVWGHWKCSHKHCSYQDLETLSVYHDCPVCGHNCDYEEIAFKVDNLDGHMDCLFEDKDGDFWIVDYKTTLLLKAQKHAKDGLALASNVTYRSQQRAYCTLAHRKYGKSHGIKPKGWILVFLPRDIPFQFVFHGEDVTPDDKRETWERICNDIEAHDIVLDATDFSEIEHLIETKPCRSMAQYRAEMDNPYSPCPLTAVCFSKGNKQLTKTIRNEMDDNVLLPIRRTIMMALDHQKELAQEVIDAQPSPRTKGKPK